MCWVMDIKMEEILKRLEELETIQHQILNAIDISKLPDELQDKLRIEKRVKERMDEITLMNEWIEKDKQEIIKFYSNKLLTKSERAEAIYYYCNIGTHGWWHTTKYKIRNAANVSSRSKKKDFRNDLIREETIAKEKYEERSSEIKKERENEIRANKLFE